jgi:hypothetical protein
MKVNLESENIIKVIESMAFGCVERNTRKMLLVPRRTKEILIRIMHEYVYSYSIIYSDYWKAYATLSNYYLTHKTVYHSKEFVNKSNGVHTNTIEGNWSGIRRNISFRNRTDKLVRIYLLRFMLHRNNNQTKLKDLTILFLVHRDND